jgi:hypothetical protein
MDNENFNILNNFLGFGNPENKIWFVGLEEAGEWTENNLDKYLPRYKKRHFLIKPGETAEDRKKAKGTYTKVYDIMSKLILAISRPDSNFDDWGDYRDGKLLTSMGNEFQMNLYPLGKKHFSETALPHKYEKLFGITKGNFEQYRTEVKNTRFPMIFKQWKYYKPLVTICFGYEGWMDVQIAFRLQTGDGNRANSERYKWLADGIILCPFFRYGKNTFSDNDLHEFGKEIQKKYPTLALCVS